MFVLVEGHSALMARAGPSDPLEENVVARGLTLDGGVQGGAGKVELLDGPVEGDEGLGSLVAGWDVKKKLELEESAQLALGKETLVVGRYALDAVDMAVALEAFGVEEVADVVDGQIFLIHFLLAVVDVGEVHESGALFIDSLVDELGIKLPEVERRVSVDLGGGVRRAGACRRVGGASRHLLGESRIGLVVGRLHLREVRDQIKVIIC